MAAGQGPVAVLPGRQGARGSPSALHGYFHKEILTCYSDRAVQPWGAMTAKARKFARPKVIAEGWTDADIDRIIKAERKAVQPLLG